MSIGFDPSTRLGPPAATDPPAWSPPRQPDAGVAGLDDRWQQPDVGAAGLDDRWQQPRAGATDLRDRWGEQSPELPGWQSLVADRVRGTSPAGPDAVAGPAEDPVGGRRRSRPRLVALALVLALVAAAGWQTYRLDRLDDRLADADRRLGDALVAEQARADGIESRTVELEQQVGKAFDPEAVSTAVLPSVFRVRAGQFTGTAFAVGDKGTAGQLNLLTNYHVVASVWEAGGHKVVLERAGVEVTGTIVKVSKSKDLARLRMSGTVKGLATDATAVRSGQQVIVVGAPLGLEDSVTTGVVSAYRPDQGDRGPTIQFDAPINPGNSGGPVINSTKQVVGIATAKARDAEGIGLAIPIKVACDTFDVC